MPGAADHVQHLSTLTFDDLRTTHRVPVSLTHESPVNNLGSADRRVVIRRLGRRRQHVGRQPVVLAHAVREVVSAVLPLARRVVRPEGRVGAACGSSSDRGMSTHE